MLPAALIDAVRTAADEIGSAVAVTDTGGHLKALERTDDATFLAAEVAVDTAWTAASYRVATRTPTCQIRMSRPSRTTPA
ncbi:heme-binding protein [Streptomyces sp. 8N706]|uniref:heme-binding protein n=1 Tax=Streptomyces sp. 8N706 TaxID=3457416 RepID=UPI003FD3CA9B